MIDFLLGFFIAGEEGGKQESAVRITLTIVLLALLTGLFMIDF